MIDPKDKELVKARGMVAPQYFNERTGEWEYIRGVDGAMYYIDEHRAKQFYRKKGEAKPTEAQDGDVVLEVDTGNVFVYYKKEWWEI